MTDRAWVIVGVTAIGAYLAWRIQAAAGGPITFVVPFLPGPPSLVGSDGSGGTNPSAANFRLAGPDIKRAGNVSILGGAPIAPASRVNPIAPPDMLTRTAMPAPPGFINTDAQEVQYLPQLGDPNLTAWDYLCTTPPDLAWGF